MLVNPKEWRHVFKLDPDREISDEHLERICMSSTDAVVVGGSVGVTFDNTIDLLSRIRRYEVPCALEVSSEEAVVPGFDLYFVPTVLNATDVKWIVGRQTEAIKQFGPMIPWEQVQAEGYIVLNQRSTVAEVTKSDSTIQSEDVIALAKYADRLLRLPIIYIEYSGEYGDIELVKRIRGQLWQARLFYGGGIVDRATARAAASAADTIIVGNIIYEHIERALETTEIF